MDEANALAVDGAGNVYVTGYSTSSTGEDYNTIKYYAEGHSRGKVVINVEYNNKT